MPQYNKDCWIVQGMDKNELPQVVQQLVKELPDKFWELFAIEIAKQKVGATGDNKLNDKNKKEEIRTSAQIVPIQ